MDPRVAAILAQGKPPPVVQVPSTGMDWIANRVLQEQPVHESEIQRICNLPISTPITDEEFEALQRVHVKPEAYEDGFRLKRVQAEAILTFAEMGQVFAPVGVGGGKTLICLRCIGIAFEQGIQRAILVVPSDVYVQLVSHDIAWVRRRVALGCSFYLMGGKSPARRRELAGSRRGCWIIPYSLLSRPDTYEILESIRPDIMIFDEAHSLKNRTTARTRRILAYWKVYRPRVCCASGTMTRKSVLDYAHTLTMSLQEGAPVPCEPEVVQEWASLIDSEQASADNRYEREKTRKTSAGSLRPLINWSNKHFPKTNLTFDTQGFRQAYQNRLLTAPGVISTPSDQLGTSIVIKNIQADLMSRPGGAALQALIEDLNSMWVSPSGDELEHAMLVWGWNNQLSSGIYYDLRWPTDDQVAKSKGLRVDEASRLVSRSKEYHRLLNEYHKSLRHWFSVSGHRPGLDTPMLVGGDMARHADKNVGPVLFKSWCAKNEANFEDRIERVSTPVRVCDYKLREAVSWCRNQELGQGIIWYYHDEVGAWLTEILKQEGIPVVHCPAGKEANKFLSEEGAADRCRGKFLVCSIRAHRQGKNLQFMVNQLFVQLPITEDETEQAIGRTHRTGQIADVVEVTTLVSSDFDELCLAAILNDAIYVQETMNSPQKVLIASWNPMPIIYGSQVLIRAGAQARMLSARQQQLLNERFLTTETLQAG